MEKFEPTVETITWKCEKCQCLSTNCYMCETCYSLPTVLTFKNHGEKWKYINKYKKVYEFFGKTRIIMPVIYVKDYDKTLDNIKIMKKNNIKYVWLKGGCCENSTLIEVFKKIRKKYQDMFIGLNFHDIGIKEVFKYLNQLIKDKYSVDGLWINDSHINDTPVKMSEEIIQEFIYKVKFTGLYFGGIFVEGQEDRGSIEGIIKYAYRYVDVIATSVEKKEGKLYLDKLKKIHDFNKNDEKELKCFIAVEMLTIEENINNIIDYCNIILAKSSNSIFTEKELEIIKQV
jgi:hypothetical protein